MEEPYKQLYEKHLNRNETVYVSTKTELLQTVRVCVGVLQEKERERRKRRNLELQLVNTLRDCGLFVCSRLIIIIQAKVIHRR